MDFLKMTLDQYYRPSAFLDLQLIYCVHLYYFQNIEVFEMKDSYLYESYSSMHKIFFPHQNVD
ncbi:uncharacterized protein METZ01_LOCUS466104, partial [marine metagenome]